MKGYAGDSKLWNGTLTVMAGLNLAAAIGFLIGGNSAFAIGCGAFSMACLILERVNELARRVRELEHREHVERMRRP